MGHAYRRTYGLRVLVLRFSNVYGRYDCDLERLERVVPLFIRNIAADEPITVFGEDKRLDFTYVEDCVDGILRAIKAISAGPVNASAINIASGSGSSLVDVARQIGELLGKRPAIRIEATRVGEVVRYVADLAAARNVLGYVPRVFLRDGLRKAVDWQCGAGILCCDAA
jgi:UDP-glucose 4-epimerase